MATPPIMAVGIRCQRSAFGAATAPMRRARARTAGVAINERARASAIQISSAKVRHGMCVFVVTMLQRQAATAERRRSTSRCSSLCRSDSR